MPSKKRPTLKLVAVHWIDAAGDRDEENMEPVDTVTCGFLVGQRKRKDGEEYLKIAGEIFTDGSYRDITAVPLGMVREVISRSVKLPESFRDWVPTKALKG